MAIEAGLQRKLLLLTSFNELSEMSGFHCVLAVFTTQSKAILFCANRMTYY